jgi:hypothetical protein
MTAPVVTALGMHRSGTSLGMSVLSALGIACGEDLIAPGRSNPAGFWEHAEIVEVQERLLARLGRVWHGTRGTWPLPDGWLDSPAAEEARRDLTAILTREIADHAPRIWGFKDPRTMRLWPLWARVFDDARATPVPVLLYRHPEPVTRSLRRHNGIDADRARLIWVQHNLAALGHTGDTLRIAVEYDSLVTDPEAQIRRIATALSDVISPDAAQIDAAVARISTDLRTHSAEPVPPDDPFAARVLDALRHPDLEKTATLIGDYTAAERLLAPWATGRANVLTDWMVRFLVSRTGR